jgi:hypothetical protein
MALQADGNRLYQSYLEFAANPPQFKSTVRGARKQVCSPERLRPEKGEKPHARANRRLTDQIRKILGKHYASKYRVR